MLQIIVLTGNESESSYVWQWYSLKVVIFITKICKLEYTTCCKKYDAYLKWHWIH